jgi:Tetratricopeptide repeat/Family of unknown function (DUF6165)/Glycosyltransferase family 9 (heptosyltransferase)
MNPPNWHAWIVQAERLFDQKQYEEAHRLAEQALRANPASAAAHQVLGLVHSEREQPQEAIPWLTRALALQPNLVPSHNGLGRCYSLLEDLDRALEHLDTALFLQPDHSFAHFNRALVWLKQGRFREGWLEYEWRWQCGMVPRPNIPRPRWDGSPLNGRAILITTEQGLGDVLQFIRLVPLVKQRGGRIVLACQKALQTLLRPLPYIDEWFPIDEPGTITFDLYSPLLSLPGLLGIEAANIPRAVPYIPADPARVERWRARLGAGPGAAQAAPFKVGVCWQGSPTFKGDATRSVPLGRFAVLAEVPGVTLVSLQKGPGVEQIEANRLNVPLTVFEDLDRDAAFVDTAALLQHLDLVITSDTAVAHLAGALGRPVWVVLGKGCDWRWLMNRADSPWYPTMRLFRQKALGDWEGLFQEVAGVLRQAVARRTQGPRAGTLIQVPISAGELLDKLTILEIKLERIENETRRANVRRELELLQAVRQQSVPSSTDLEALAADLKQVNEQLWEIEDELRRCERALDFGVRFIELARQVYQTNERRFAVKTRINDLLRSPLVEEKCYGGSAGGKDR